MGVHRHVFRFKADAAGAFKGLFLHIEGVILALQTRSGVPSADSFEVRLLRDDGESDVLQSSGLRRDPSRVQRTVVRCGPNGEHPAVDRDDRLCLQVTGNSVPFAEVSLHLFVGEDRGIN